jgi:hypothetical protein
MRATIPPWGGGGPSGPEGAKHSLRRKGRARLATHTHRGDDRTDTLHRVKSTEQTTPPRCSTYACAGWHPACSYNVAPAPCLED